jgi:hypothetical protein
VSYGTSRPVDPLYHRAGTVVTYDVLETGGNRYRIASLRGLRTARGEASPITWWTVVLSGTVLAAVGITVSFGRHPSGPRPLTYLMLMLAAVVPITIGLYSRHRARRSHELWGEYLGETRLLYADTDEREFGRVTRALLRAREAGRR